MNVQPAKLRVDTYPITFSPVVFSYRLTKLEVLTGGHYTHIPDVDDWHQILSHTPRLVWLRLWSSRHRPFAPINASTLTPIQLPFLEQLELSGAFNMLYPLLIKSTLPSLSHLLVDFLGTSLSSPNNIPQQIYELVSVSPALACLQVGSLCFSPKLPTRAWWAKVFQSTSSLRVVKLFEMEWLEMAIILEEITAAHSLSFVEARNIWDINKQHLERLLFSRPELPPINFLNCLDSQSGRCTNEYDSYLCESDSGSSFHSSNDSSSEVESDSEDSDCSYGDDEGSEIGYCVRNPPA
ncbi:hypothetical protein RhiLY_03297 [Ceratobasidium sp. AG-Ba]|nr:hypothetical protein RhiLY_03297 [Ceratobasidium sp. AG-Ba]